MNIKRYLLLISLALVLWGCSTNRNTWLSRGYQNLTARYNVLFNGSQSFSEGRESMRKGTADDFTSVLPMFAYSPASGAAVASSQMQRAIDKGHKLIKEHSITVKPNRKPGRKNEAYRTFYNQREFNRWVDDAWMLIGKAHVYQREWSEAVYAFEMVLRDFPDHPSRFEALLWMARAYVEAGELENARLALSRYESAGEAPPRFYSDVMATYARYWLARNDLEQALTYCTAAAESTGDRWEKIRWHFVLGQVSEQLGMTQRAGEAFKKVVNLNPRYEMSFHARVKVALLEGGPDNPGQARAGLNKLLRQSKNREYRDQLYYSLADTWFWENDTLQALTQLKLAAGYSMGNQMLKGKVFLKMADVYYDTRQYVAAHAYYDSSLVTLPGDYAGLGRVKILTQKLAPVSASLQILQHEDSVQRIAALPDDQRELFIENLIAASQLKEAGGEFSSTADDAFFFQNLANRGNQTTDEQGNWYFYNPTMVSLGKMEFEKRWGRRALNDNWRRNNKTAQRVDGEERDMDMMPPDPFDAGDGPGSPGGGTARAPAAVALPDRQSLLDGLPLTPQKMEASQQRREDAMYGAGMGLYEQLQKYREAGEMLEKLLAGFPETEHRQQALMTLYLVCRDLDDQPCMALRKQQYLAQFPDSRFSDYLSDPDYVEKQAAIQELMNRQYQEAYRYYKAGDWEQTINKAETVLAGDFEPLKPKAVLLMAMAQGRKGNTQLFQSGLSEVVSRFEGSNEAALAGEWLAMLEQGRKPVKVESTSLVAEVAQTQPGQEAVESTPETAGFVSEPDSAHYMLMVVSNEADINQLMFNVADYNFERFLIGDYHLKTEKMADGRRVLSVGPFPNKSIGMDYFYAVRDNRALLKGAHAAGSSFFLVSESNLKPLLLSGDVPAYQDFFLQNYLPGSQASAVVVGELQVPEYEAMIEEEEMIEESVAFVPNTPPLMGMVVIPSESGNKKRAQQFLPNYVRNITSVSVLVSEEQLKGGTTVLLIKDFDDKAAFDKLQEALKGNPYWNNQLAGSDWAFYPVSVDNFKMIEELGDTKAYVKFLGEAGNKN